jgi:hypothetical protein
VAIIFEMWAECSSEAECAALIQHFDGFQMRLLTGRTISWKANRANIPKGMVVHSPDLSGYGIRNLQDALETTECGVRLYHHLKNGPAFRFARVAWEAELVPLEELGEYVVRAAPNECRIEIDCVIDNSLYRQLGSPQFCFPFRDGYWWTRYGGEKYLPLYSDDQPDLNQLCRSLFQEYFKY